MDNTDKRLRFSVTEENYEWMQQFETSASKMINTLLNRAREAEENLDELFETQE